MKKFTAFKATATTLFITGEVGLICFYFFTQKSLDNYFAFIIILAIATLPRTFFEFFMVSENIEKNSAIGIVRFFLFFLNFSIMSDSIFPSTTRYAVIIHLIIVMSFFLWGLVYYRKHPSKTKNSQ